MRFGGVRPASCASMPHVSNRDGAADVLAGFLQANPEIRVELTIDNGEGLLRPGMTAFARIDFDRRMLARVLLHKIKQALRPELWIL